MTTQKYIFSKSKFADNLYKIYPDSGADNSALFDKIVALDPTSTAKDEKQRYKFLDWICRKILDQRPQAQDLYKIQADLNFYIRLARLDKIRASREGTVYYKPYVDPNIEKYSIRTLAEAVFPHQELLNRKTPSEQRDHEKKKASTESIVLYDGEAGKIVIPQTMESSQFWGRETRWCISASKSDNLFEKYNQDGKTPILMFLPRNIQDKFAFNEQDGSVRDAMDSAIEEYSNQQFDSKTGVVAQFLSDCLMSGKMDIKQIAESAEITRAFKAFAFKCPQAYGIIIDKTAPDKIPDFLGLPALIHFAREDIDADEEASEFFYTVPNIFLGLLSNPALADFKEDALDAISTPTLLKTIKSHLQSFFKTPDDFDTFSPEESSRQFIEIYTHAQEFYRSLPDRLGMEYEIEYQLDELAFEYLDKIPKSFWKDEGFAFRTLECIGFSIGETLDRLPDAYQHPIVWKTMMEDSFNLQQCCEAIAAPQFHHIWTSRIDDVPFLEAVLPVIKQLADAEDIYKGSESADGVDYAPLIKRIETLYPDGLQTEEEVEIISTEMPKCDFTALLEKTIAAHPDFFADVAPEKQTLPMAVAAVKHDPGSLADIAENLFKAKRQPPELGAAFNQLPLDSIEREAVARFFISPAVK